MKKFLTMLMVSMVCISLLAPIAEAKRLGGGSSFGKQRAVPQKQMQKTPAPPPAASPVPVSGGNKWLGPLAGLAIGAGLASMFAGGGMAGLGNMLSSLLPILLLAGLALFLFARFKQSQQSVLQPGAAYAGSNTMPQSNTTQHAVPASTFAESASLDQHSIPNDFPVESFLRNAKASFIRLQAANDRKDLDDIREYTTPEVFAEISMQMRERGNILQKTDVIVIDAELLEVVNEADYMIASVRFTGQLRENNDMPENIDEIWHIQKNLRDSQAIWLLAGIQQASVQ